MRRDQVAPPGGHDDELRQLGVRRSCRGPPAGARACAARPPRWPSDVGRGGLQVGDLVVGPHQARCRGRRRRRRRPRRRRRAVVTAVRRTTPRPVVRRPKTGDRSGDELRHRRRLLVLLAARAAGWRWSTTAPRAGAPPSCPWPPPPRAGRRARPGSAGRRQVLLELGELVAVDGVEGVGRQELARLLVGHHASTPRTPASARTARMRRMPLRIRLLTVPSGWSSSRATSR